MEGEEGIVGDEKGLKRFRKEERGYGGAGR